MPGCWKTWPWGDRIWRSYLGILANVSFFFVQGTKDLDEKWWCHWFPPSSGLVREPPKQHAELVYLGNFWCLVKYYISAHVLVQYQCKLQAATSTKFWGAGIWTCQWSQCCVKGKHSQFQGVVVMLAGNPRVSAFLSLILRVLNTKRWRKFVLFKFAAKLRTVPLLGRITAHAYPISSQYIL